MEILDSHEAIMWLAIASMIALASVTGMYINRFFIHRAHRRALADLKRRILRELADSPHHESEHSTQYVE